MDLSTEVSPGNMDTQIASPIHYTVNESNNLPPLSASVPATPSYDNKGEHSPSRSIHDVDGTDPCPDNLTFTGPQDASPQLDQPPEQDALTGHGLSSSSGTNLVLLDQSKIQETRSASAANSGRSESPHGSKSSRNVPEYDSEEDYYTLPDSPIVIDASRTDNVPRPKPFSKKNLKRHRETRFLLNQFGQNPHPDAAQRGMLAKQINGLTARQIQVWFQNRRAKLKRMSAADADRMLSTRSYPDGYGPQGFADRPSITREPTHPLSYTQSVEGVYANHLYHDRHICPPRSTPPVLVHHSSSSSFVGHEQMRTPQSAIYPSHYDRDMSHSPLPDRSYHRQFDIRASYDVDHSQIPDTRNVQGRGPVHNLVSAYDRPYGHTLRPSHIPINVQQNFERHYSLSPQYPRSAPLEPHSTSSTSAPFLHPADSPYLSDREYQTHRLQAGRSSEHGNTCNIKHDPPRQQGGQYEIQAMPSSYLSPPSAPRTAPSYSFSTAEHLAIVESQYSDVRHSNHDQYHNHAEEEYRAAGAQHDIHYYYGTEEHIKHEDEELQEARRLFEQQRQEEYQRGQALQRTSPYVDSHESLAQIYARTNQIQEQFEVTDHQEEESQHDPTDYACPQAGTPSLDQP